MNPTQTIIGPYELLDHLGSGGMGVVYRARDTRLQRDVAIKLLPESFLGPGSPGAATHERFLREARAASSLNHPNICTIHDVGEQGGKPYLVMELLHGEDLKAAVGGRALEVPQVIDFGIQLASALAEAHSAGIIHRDIKPANVFVIRKPQGRAQIKVLDFGLAKRHGDLSLADSQTLMGNPGATIGATVGVGSDATSGGSLDLTSPGSTLGTVGYMSPEQAEGLPLDARSDIFSAGSVLYEMATGVAPFRGSSPASIFAALLKDQPIAPSSINPAVTKGLERVILKCLAKDKTQRYASAADLRSDLESLAGWGSSGSGPIAAASAESASSPNSKIIYGAVAVLVILLAAGGYWLWHKKTEKPAAATVAGAAAAGLPTAERDSLILADFVNNTGDPVFDTTLNQALAIQLQQSPVITILSTQHLRQSMQYLGKSPDEKLTPAIAREIGEREGVKAILTGTIASIGKQYVITLAAQTTATGDDIASEQAEAADKEHVLEALDKAATAMRARLGESLSSIQKLDTPFGQATTTSLEAFRAYALGDVEHSKGLDLPEAEGHYRRAVEIDPNFAMAWARLGVVYGNSAAEAKSEECFTKAYKLAKNVSEREKFYIDAHYYRSVLGDLPKTEETLQLAVRTYPKSSDTWVNLSVVDSALGNDEKAVEDTKQALALQPENGIAQLDLIEGLIGLDRLDEAKKAEASANKLGVTGGAEHSGAAYQLAYLTGDQAAMAAQIAKAQGTADEYRLGQIQGAIYASQGQMNKMEDVLRRASEQAAAQKFKDAQASLLLVGAENLAFVGLCQDVSKIVQEALALDHSRDSQVGAAQVNALCGDGKMALATAAELDRKYPNDTIIQNITLPELRAAVLLKQQKPEEALRALEPAEAYDAVSVAPYFRGLAYLQLKDGNKAAAAFERALRFRGHALRNGDYALSQLGLAHAYAMQGNKAATKKAYQDFFTTWKDADSDLPPLEAAKAEFAAL